MINSFEIIFYIYVLNMCFYFDEYWIFQTELVVEKWRLFLFFDY